jgi:hypothetical protein
MNVKVYKVLMVFASTAEAVAVFAVVARLEASTAPRAPFGLWKIRPRSRKLVGGGRHIFSSGDK